MTETEAIVALKGGDREALSQLVELHQAKALRLAFAISGDRSSAEDIVADAFLSVHQNIRRFDASRPFEPWFLRIVSNAAISAARKSRTRRKVLDLLRHSTEPTPDPIVLAEQNAERRKLIECVRNLPPKERAAITVRYLLDFDEATAAQILDCPLGTLKTRLHRARVALRASIEQEQSTQDMSQAATKEA